MALLVARSLIEDAWRSTVVRTVCTVRTTERCTEAATFNFKQVYPAWLCTVGVLTREQLLQ